MKKDTTFYGPLKIKFVTDLDNNRFVELEFTNGEKLVVTKKVFELSVTQEAKDYNYLQQVKINAMVKEVMDIVLAYGIQLYEINALLSAIGKETKERFSRAINYLWTKDDKKYIPGSDPTDYFSLNEAETVVKTIPLPKKDVPKETK